VSSRHSDADEPPAENPHQAQLALAEKLLREIRDGKHSLPGTLAQIERYFARRAEQADGDTAN
jgi:hypothetical protein